MRRAIILPLILFVVVSTPEMSWADHQFPEGWVLPFNMAVDRNVDGNPYQILMSNVPGYDTHALNWALDFPPLPAGRPYPVRAPADGRVTWARDCGDGDQCPGGYTVVLHHGKVPGAPDDYASRYLHLDRARVVFSQSHEGTDVGRGS